MDSIPQLVSAYLDGELSDDQASRLAKSLEVEPAELDRFVLTHFIHSQLLDWMDQQRMEDGAMSCALAAFDEEAAPLSPAVPRGSRARLRGRPHWRGAVAALLLIAAGISAVAYIVSSRPVIVAQLTEAKGCQWGASQNKVPVGSLLHGGQPLDLVQGTAVLTFTSGAKVSLEAPASLRLDSNMEIHLASGQIAAKVPRQAIGFTVTSSLAKFVDRGTQFQLNLQSEKSFQLHVFEGLVEVWLDDRFGKAASHPANIAEVRAVSFDVQAGDIEFMHFQEGKQMPF